MAKPKGNRKQSGVKKPPLTHFLCLPLVTPASRPQLEASLRAFQDDVVLKSAEKPGSTTDEQIETTATTNVHPKAIRHVGSLHCTLGVMSLDKERLPQAIEFLRGLNIPELLSGALETPVAASPPITAVPGVSTLEEPISPPDIGRSAKPIEVDLTGLVSMHAPQRTSILYAAPTDHTGRLLPLCSALQKAFQDKGFLIEDNRELKLHATVVNTIYAKGRRGPRKRATAESSSEASASPTSSGHGIDANAPLKIDATAIIEKYKDFPWATNVVLDRVAICEMGAKKITDDDGNVVDEIYTEVASVALPSA